MKHPVAVTAVLFAVLVSVSGCAGLIDPYKREGTWNSTGINDANLRLMLATPSDFERGTGAEGSLGGPATVAVARFRADNVKKLPDANFGPTGGASNEGAPVSNTGGAQ